METAEPRDRRRTRPHPETLGVGALLTALVALGQISTSIYIPSMPSLVTALSTDTETVNLTLSMFLFGFAACQLVFGPLSDRYGRRPVLLVGVALYAGSSALCAVGPSITWLVVGRLLQGMTACSGPVLGRAIIRDVYGPVRSAKALAYVGVALAVSPAVAPIIGGYLQQWFGWRAAFWFLTAIGCALVAAVATMLEETAPKREAEALRLGALFAAWRILLTSSVYYGYVLAVAFVFAGLMAFTAGAPFVFIELIGLSPAEFGMLAVFNVAGFLVGSLAAGRLALRVGLDRLLFVGTVLTLAGGVAMSVAGFAGILTIPAVIAPMMVFTAGMGLVLATGIAGAMAPFPAIAGAASALLGFIQMLVAGLASLAVGAFPQSSQVPMATVIAVTAAAAFLSFTVLVWRRRADRSGGADVPPPSARSAG